MEERFYLFQKLADAVIEQSTTIKRSPLLNNTISTRLPVNAMVSLLADPSIPPEKVALWSVIVIEADGVFIPCNLHCSYNEALQTAVCLDVVYNHIMAHKDSDIQTRPQHWARDLVICQEAVTVYSTLI